MGKSQRKCFENLYYEARKSASVWDARLKTQEGAAEILNIASYTLGEYERGDVKVVPADRVVDMARAYNAPELMTDYCVNVCPIKGFLPMATEERGIQGIALRMIMRLGDKELQRMKDELVAIAEDGEVTPDEAPRMEQILRALEGIAETISEMKLIAMKKIGASQT